MGFEPQTVFVLQHGKGEYADEELKFIGVFRNRKAAKSAIEDLKTKPGFCTGEGRFSLDEYTLDQRHWTSGYISWLEAFTPLGEPLPCCHIHVYYDIARRDDVLHLCKQLHDEFDLVMGGMHDGPTGPHPRGSCQLTVPWVKFGDVIAWLIENRNDLTIFAHAVTGDKLKDYTEQFLWLGPSETLDLSAFSRSS